MYSVYVCYDVTAVVVASKFHRVWQQNKRKVKIEVQTGNGIVALPVICGGKSSVLWSEISFYGEPTAANRQRSRKTQFATMKTTIYLPTWHLSIQLSPF